MADGKFRDQIPGSQLSCGIVAQSWPMDRRTGCSFCGDPSRVSSVTVSRAEEIPGGSSPWRLVLGRLWVERVAEPVAQEIKGEEGQ